MPGRTRRVRLLAVAVCIFIVFFLYQRNEAQVESYTDYFTQSAVGGGAVLRKEGEQKQEPIPAPQQETSELKPALRPEGIADTAPATTNALVESTESPEPTLTPTSTRRIGLDDLTSSTTTIPSFDDNDELPVPVGPGRLDDDVYDPYSPNDFPAFPTTTYKPIHWSKQKEHFPVSSTIELPSGKPSAIPLIQKRGEGKGVADKQRLAAIKEACEFAWNGFRENGWGFDELKPVAGIGKNSFNGWGATLVDSLDTLWIMGMKEEFEDAVNKTAQIDFTASSRADIPMFEVTIRYLGGLIAAFDVSERKYKVLLDKAVELAEVLYSAFDTPNRMPMTYYYWKPAMASNPHRASTRVVMAELGTLSLEFTRLAQLTGEPKYYDAIARITDEFQEWQNNTKLPGMWPTMLDASGCKKPEYVPPSHTVNQMPLPQGDGYMVSSEPVKVAPKVMEDAESRLNKPKAQVKPPPKAPTPPQKAPGSGPQDKMGSVANPANMMAGPGSDSLRHSMDEHPANGDSIYRDSDVDNEDTVNTAGSKDPLKPGAGASNDKETSMDGFRAMDPLPPNAASNPHSKRQLDSLGDMDDPITNYTSTNSTLHHEGLRQLDYETAKEPECIPQGLASTSKNAMETYTLGGQSDSTYEYLPKMHLLIGGRFDQYKEMYLDSMQPVIDELLFKPMTKDNRDILVSGEVHMNVNYTTGEPELTHVPKGEHLTCFVGGMFALGGKIFNLPEHLEIGSKLTDGCVWAYNITNTGIMPETFTLATCDDKKKTKGCEWSQSSYEWQLDPYGGFRGEQREQFMEQYEIKDLEAYEKEVAAASSSSTAAAAMAAKTEAAGLNDIEDAHTFAHHDDMTLRKRQLDSTSGGYDADEAAGPQLAPPPGATTSSTPTTSDLEDIWSGYGRPSDEFLDDVVQPVRPIYTPPPPPTHEQYVMQKIEDERLPTGFVHLASKAYILRPEAIESVFYMYRITGDQYWRDVGWKMFQSVDRHTRAKYGHSAIDDVTKSSPTHVDSMESFWIAETLKYYYLLFDEPDTWSLDDWVLNTEAHFFRRPENPVKA